MEVGDILGVGFEDLGLNWELQPWWQAEPRVAYEPRDYEPHPSRLRSSSSNATATTTNTCTGGTTPGAVPPPEARQGTAVAGASAAGGAGCVNAHWRATCGVSNLNAQPGLLAAQRQADHRALLHYHAAQLHAAAKFDEFLCAVPLPYGLCGEEAARDVAMYDRFVYAESTAW